MQARRQDSSGTSQIFYGQSLGGAVAIDLAARNSKTVRILILHEADIFTSAII
jgi:hypothetical protein